jgi:cell division protein FtsN
MKRNFTVFTLCFLMFFSASLVLAQKNKDKDKDKDKVENKDKDKPDKKSFREAKKEMREYYYDIEKYESLKQDMAKAKAKSDSLNEELEKLRQLETNTETEADKLKEEKERNEKVVAELEEKASQPAELKEIPDGIFFSIQIGAYYRRNISHLIEKDKADLKVEENNGMKKYLIGGYTSYEEAAEARKKLRSVGAKDAWIVAYKDGQRVPMSEVRETPISEEELKELEKLNKN